MARPAFIPLASGAQTELADQLVQPGATLVLENCASPQTGKTRVRFGSDVLSTATQATLPSGGTLPVPWQLATLGGGLVRFNRAPVPLHTWAPAPAAWVLPENTGGIESFRRGPVKLDTSPVFSGTAQITDVDVAVSANAIVVVYRLDTGLIGTTGTNVVILDRLTRRPIYTRRTSGGTRGQKVVIVGTRAVVAYESGGFLQVDSYNLTTYTLAQQQTMGSLLAGTAFEMRVGAPVAGANNVGILYRTVATGQLRCAVVDATNLAVNSTFTPRTTAAAVVVPDLTFGWMQDIGASAKFAIMIADSTNGLRTLWDMPAPAAGFSNATATHVLDAAALNGVRNLIGTTITNSATGVYRVLYEVSAAAPVLIKVAVWNGAASIGVQFRSVGIRSKFWQHSTNFYFMAAFDAADQRSYFVLAVANDTVVATTTFPAPLAVAFPRGAAGLTESTTGMSAAVVGADGEIYVAVTHETRTDSVASGGAATGGTTRLFAADVVRIRHPVTAETELGRPAEFLRSLFVPGGALGHFDGTTFALAGFAYYPTGASALSQVGGSLTPSATYRYRFVFSFLDRNGRKWRSAPSTPFLASTTGANFKFQLSIDTLRLADRGQATGAYGYQIEAYRTQANATQGFLQVATIANDPSVDSVTFVDNVPDSALGEELYTDGGGVENQLLPPIAWCVEHQGRLVCGEAGTGTLWYSVEADFTSGLIFNEALTLDVGDPSEPSTGGAVFGEQLFVFKGNKTYIVGGQGANALGQGATYTPRLIDGAIGCSNPQSIIVGDDGVWFRSSSARAGIHRTAGGPAEYVGQGVRAYDALTITSAVVVRNETEIRWYTLDGTTLKWNWTTKSWGWNTTQPCLSATIGYAGAAGVVYARYSDSFVLSEATATSAAPYKEAGQTYLARSRSPWYQAAGIGGWERIKRIQGVGEAGSAHRAVIGLYKDMNPTAFQFASIVFDGTFRPQWDWEMRPAHQKATAMMVEVTIFPYQPPNVVITPGTDVYNGIDPETGGGAWTFQHAAFTSDHVGASFTIAGDGAKNGTYTITAVVSPTQVVMTPLPAGPIGAFVATSISFVPALQYTAGPGILGVSLIAAAKEGADKLGSSRRVT